MIGKLLSHGVAFVAGAVAPVVVAWLAFSDVLDEFSLRSAAYLDRAPCDRLESDAAVGAWRGEHVDGVSSVRRDWEIERFEDGTYRLEFAVHDDNPPRASVERGYWAVDGCLYTTLVMEIDGEPALYQEVYRLHEIDPLSMAYTNFRTGTTYRVHRLLE